jgi:hypothetical protein
LHFNYIYKLNRMNTNSTSVSSIKDAQIKNKGFAILHELFVQHGWHLIKNDFEWIVYSLENIRKVIITKIEIILIIIEGRIHISMSLYIQ